ncbi:hypothetical protein NEOLI_005002 [Neolecta irregularis DAH-3]|uniref:Uncharacterized protein n=1 Tax=Neolecta irregularis (strain DAH-3) TaxID=1198029 RepID=A0A1U7LLX6_NEOID|nr:hypothetical protein NEOLI_005002 [Neolecta irregularis DAH-3]|eukprot:OLL23638.1 hypothetical protein NEOLI_005002 [Neolecta irregularis DAH-3]
MFIISLLPSLPLYLFSNVVLGDGFKFVSTSFTLRLSFLLTGMSWISKVIFLELVTNMGWFRPRFWMIWFKQYSEWGLYGALGCSMLTCVHLGYLVFNVWVRG